MAIGVLCRFWCRALRSIFR